jgi:hypothetical protein
MEILGCLIIERFIEIFEIFERFIFEWSVQVRLSAGVFFIIEANQQSIVDNQQSMVNSEHSTILTSDSAITDNGFPFPHLFPKRSSCPTTCIRQPTVNSQQAIVNSQQSSQATAQ